MRTEVFLVLLMTLVSTDGLNNVTFNREKRDLFSNSAYPCQRSQNNNAYNTFNRRHILSEDFDRNSERAWAFYLNRKGLCGRTPVQSFLSRRYSDRIKRICNGEGTRDTGNLCISMRSFTVYIVESSVRYRECEVHVRRENSYVSVACEVIDNECVPVHYEEQTNRRPSQRGQICRP